MIIRRETIDTGKKTHSYFDKSGKEITDKKILEYIEALPPIPPAYSQVEIFYEKIPKILFQGRDIKGRLQQIYSPKWRASADKKKFQSLIEFGRALPTINIQILKNIKSSALSKDKIIAIMLKMVQLCGFRIGSLKYYRLNKSIGLSTLLPKHITVKKNGMHIKFLGKKGVENNCIITDPLIIKEMNKFVIGKKSTDFIFSYYNKESGIEELIDGGDINLWLKKYNPDFTTKFFRTFSVNILFIELMRGINPSTLTATGRKKEVAEVLKELSCSINNSPTICKKSYLSQDLVKLYIEQPKKYQKNINLSNKNPIQIFVEFLETL